MYYIMYLEHGIRQREGEVEKRIERRKKNMQHVKGGVSFIGRLRLRPHGIRAENDRIWVCKIDLV